MKKISKLDQNLINLIAAGEVVERPSSVIKELVENSVDAESTKIIVHLKNFGEDLIEVEDNGIGISKEDLPLVLEQHATSKIKTENDLHKILSFGFRGEAIASIGSVAKDLVIDSKVKSSNISFEVSAKNPEVRETLNRTEIGTSVRVYELFKNVPARKKFLKQSNTELKHIYSTFIETALPFINIHFELYNDKKLVYKLTKTNTLKNRIFEIWGKSLPSNLIENSTDFGEIKLRALIGNTESGKKRNNQQFIYINNRFIKSKSINSAVANAYKGFMHRDLQPSYFLMLDLDPKEVDINVHPRKLEAKFSNEKEIFSKTYNFIRKTLESNLKSFITTSIESNKTNENELAENNDFASYVESIPSKSSQSYVKKSSSDFSSPRSVPRVNDALNFTQTLYKPVEHSSVENRYQRANIKEVDIQSDSYHEVTSSFYQAFNTYIIFEKENELIFIDQHAAAEKINFEKILKNLGKINTKPLLIPQIIELKNLAEKTQIIDSIEQLNRLGIRLEDFGGNSIQITEIPEILSNFDANETISELLVSDYAQLGVKIDHTEKEQYHIDDATYIKIATIACHGSIRAGQKLSQNEMFQIISDLKKLDNPYNCPHGRPIMWKLNKTQIEKSFNRDI